MITIIGGTYREVNLEQGSHEIFGSGLRSANYILENTDSAVQYYTFGDCKVQKHLNNYKKIFKAFNFQIEEIDHLITFKYNFALDNPDIYPDPNTLNIGKPTEVVGDNIICFGSLEGSFNSTGNKVVYDPQTSINPKLFSTTNKAQEVIYVVNKSEAESISKSKEINEILNFFFDVEKVKALIIKNGPSGAKVYLSNSEGLPIPAYITDKVHKIGSGDIFTTAFSYYWFNTDWEIPECALYASKSTALYCNYGAGAVLNKNSIFEFKEFNPQNISNKQVYLAGPIFSLSEIILVDKVREALLGFGIKVFSPYHDVGYGNSKQIAIKDIQGIENSDIILCLLDGLDSGTLIELGYAMSKGKKLIGYHTTVEHDSLFMLKVADIEYYNDLTTALYKVIWSL